MSIKMSMNIYDKRETIVTGNFSFWETITIVIVILIIVITYSCWNGSIMEGNWPSKPIWPACRSSTQIGIKLTKIMHYGSSRILSTSKRKQLKWFILAWVLKFIQIWLNISMFGWKSNHPININNIQYSYL